MSCASLCRGRRRVFCDASGCRGSQAKVRRIEESLANIAEAFRGAVLTYLEDSGRISWAESTQIERTRSASSVGFSWMSRLPNVDGEAAVAAFKKLGFEVARVQGSHYILKRAHLEEGRRRTSPDNSCSCQQAREKGFASIAIKGCRRHGGAVLRAAVRAGQPSAVASGGLGLVVPHISDCPSPCPLPQVLRGHSRRSGEARSAKDLGRGYYRDATVVTETRQLLPRRDSCYRDATAVVCSLLNRRRRFV